MDHLGGCKPLTDWSVVHFVVFKFGVSEFTVLSCGCICVLDWVRSTEELFSDTVNFICEAVLDVLPARCICLVTWQESSSTRVRAASKLYLNSVSPECFYILILLFICFVPFSYSMILGFSVAFNRKPRGLLNHGWITRPAPLAPSPWFEDSVIWRGR